MVTIRPAESFPTLAQTVLDTTDVRGLAEFYRQFLGLHYRPGDEPRQAGAPELDWLVLRDDGGRRELAFQQVAELPVVTWPAGPVAQQLHLDLSVPTMEALDLQHGRALSLGASLLDNRRDDPDEAVIVYADPAGHPFCLFVEAST